MTTDRHCLDAETVAAWMDGGLDAAGVAAAEAHASTCERCQTLLATMAKTLPAEDLVVQGTEGRGTARFWKWWLAPIAATAAAVTIWMVVPQTPMQAPVRPPAASAPARDMAVKPQAVPAEPAAQASAPAETPASLADARRNVRPTAGNESKAKLADTAAAKADGSAVESRDASASPRGQSAELRRDAEGKREENSARAAEMRQAVETALPPATPAERMRELPPPAAPPSPAAPRVGSVTQLRKPFAAPEIVSPDPTSRWRATTPGIIERSEDGGRIWIPVRILAKEEVLAGASPGRLVCWLVGRDGLVLLATDGTNFTRLPFPERVDLVAVTSPEPRSATVTTADGRVYHTEDAGRAWRIF